MCGKYDRIVKLSMLASISPSRPALGPSRPVIGSRACTHRATPRHTKQSYVTQDLHTSTRVACTASNVWVLTKRCGGSHRAISPMLGPAHQASRHMRPPRTLVARGGKISAT
eukprot:70308-Chlamydomonas_euryale.AAC.2